MNTTYLLIGAFIYNLAATFTFGFIAFLLGLSGGWIMVFATAGSVLAWSNAAAIIRKSRH